VAADDLRNQEASLTDQKYDYRLTALKTWADDVRARGFVAPTNADLAAIAKAKVPDAPGVDRTVVDPWRGAIKELLKQVAFNISEPHRQLGPEFDAPEIDTTVEGTQEHPSPVVDNAAGDPAYKALKAWRDKASADGRLLNSVLKESNLRQLANSGRKTAADIRAILPSTANHFAEELEEALGKVPPTGRPAAAKPAGGEGVRETPPAAKNPLSTFSNKSGTTARPTTDRAKAPPKPLTRPTEPAAPVTMQAEDKTGKLQEDAVTGIDPSAFAAYDYTSLVGVLVPLRFSKHAGGKTMISWASPASDAPVRIYRLVSNDEHPPYAPEHADLVAVTKKEEAFDDRPLRTAVRYVQVWLNEGLTDPDALSSQPTLHANDAYVAQVQDLDLREDEGRVIGRWTSLPRTKKVQIFRIPVERAAIGAGDPQYRILAESNNLGGFVDAAATRGSSYLYQIYAESEVDGVAKLSKPVSAPVKLSAILAPVSDLEITLRDNGERPLFDLRWSQPPAGRVVIYRTEQPPTPGIELEPHAEDVLEQAKLKLELRLLDPFEEAQGSALMTSVPWPNGWTRAYFTPVTLLNGLAHVGTTILKSRNEKVSAPKILERVNTQILTFEWPEGADSVLVYQGRTGQDPAVALNGAPLEISKSGYAQRGGLHFPHPLPDEGCDLHLVPITFEAGARVSGEPTTVNYPWILKLSYEATIKRNLLGKITGVSVTLRSEKSVASPPPFVLVYHPDRLPLTGRDGIALSMIKDVDGAPAPNRRFVPDRISPSDSGTAWRTEPKAWADEVSQSGFVRLFVDLPVDAMKQVALLDPPLARLSLNGGAGPTKGLFGGR
jgi:hypothetical protein